MASELIYTTINSKIEESLGKVSRIKEIYPYPATDVTKYPAAIFYPSEFQNSFETNEENMQTKGYKLFIVVNGEQKDKDTLFSTILAKAVDAVLNQLAADWDVGTIDGHRTWLRVDSGVWGQAQHDKGIEAWAEFNLIIKLLTNNS